MGIALPATPRNPTKMRSPMNLRSTAGEDDELVTATAVRHRGGHGIRAGVGQRDGCTWHAATAGVPHRAADGRCARGLSEDHRWCLQEHHRRHGGDDRQPRRLVRPAFRHLIHRSTSSTSPNRSLQHRYRRRQCPEQIALFQFQLGPARAWEWGQPRRIGSEGLPRAAKAASVAPNTSPSSSPLLSSSRSEE
jgi:hypothetical protein